MIIIYPVRKILVYLINKTNISALTTNISASITVFVLYSVYQIFLPNDSIYIFKILFFALLCVIYLFIVDYSILKNNGYSKVLNNKVFRIIIGWIFGYFVFSAFLLAILPFLHWILSLIITIAYMLIFYYKWNFKKKK